MTILPTILTIFACSDVKEEGHHHDYEMMFRWFRTEKRYKQCAPKSRKPFKLIEEKSETSESKSGFLNI